MRALNLNPQRYAPRQREHDPDGRRPGKVAADAAETPEAVAPPRRDGPHGPRRGHGPELKTFFKHMQKNTQDKRPADPPRKSNYIDIFSGRCRALSKRYKLSSAQTEAMVRLVEDTATKCWRDGRVVGWVRGQEEAKGGQK